MQKSKLLLLCGILLTTGCRSEVPGVAPPVDQFIFPMDVLQHPSEPYLFVLNGNLDLRYAASTLNILDMRGDPEILPDETVAIAPFGMELHLSSADDLWIPTRGAGQVFVLPLKMGVEGQRIACDPDRENDIKGVRSCIQSGRYIETPADDPVSVKELELTQPDGSTHRVIFLGAFNSKYIRAYRADDPFNEDTQWNIPMGVSGLSALTVVGGTRLVAFPFPESTRFGLQALWINTLLGVHASPSQTTLLPRVYGHEVVDAVYSPGVQMMFLLSQGWDQSSSTTLLREPLNMLTLVRVDASAAEPIMEVTQSLETCEGATQMHLIPATVNREELMSIACTIDGRVDFWSTTHAVLVGSTRVGTRPFGMEYDTYAGDRLFVANFDSDSISVIGLDPDSSTYLEVVDTIGEVAP